ncbi:energy-coupling factor transporter transmembrane protein EcfT, partial [bacterium M00.F.Ca.ET.177.01.1.1]
LDPRIKIALILMISLVALTGGVTGVEVYLRAIIILVPALLLLCIKKYTIGLSVLILTVIAWYGEAFVTIDGNQVATLLIFVPSGIVTRFLPSLAMGYYIFKTTQIEVLIT